MTTAREIRWLTAPLLERQPDVALVGRMFLVLHPVRHVLRCVCIDRTSDKNQFRPSWVLAHLFSGRRGIWVDMGDRIARRGERPRWLLDLPDVDAEFCAQIEEDVLPRLRTIDGIGAYVEAVTTGPMSARPLHWPGERMFAHVAMNELAEARAICAQNVARWAKQGWEGMQGMADNWKRMADLVLADDRAGMIALLHEREAYSVVNLKLDHLWERTPFPLETGDEPAP